jgi:TonB-linked SusC/RagA family outer membrane protein
MRKTILLALLFASTLSTFAQTRTIRGRVLDSLGNGISGASITLKGTKTGTAADATGAFTLSAKEGDVLVVSALNYLQQEVPITAVSEYQITLRGTQATISEVVVTALGLRRNRNELPYAAQQVSSDEITKTRTNNFANSLSGKVAGLQIKANNNLGGSTNIILRGYKSITGNNQALIVIDGVPVSNANTNSGTQQNGFGGYDYGNAASDFNPDDIASVNVLKGAAATALYGSRAANGVILITTKKGTRGLGITLNLGGSTGSMDESTWVKYQHQYGAGYYDPDYYTYSDAPPSPDSHFLYFDADGDGTDDLVVPTTEDASFGARFDPNLMVFQWDAFDPTSPNYLKKTPWIAAKNDPTEFFETPYSYNVGIGVSGGSDKGTFRLGYTRTNDKGILPNSKLIKDMINFEAEYKITDNLTASASTNFSKISGLGRYGNGYDAFNVATNFREWWQMNVDVKDQEAAYRRTGKNITWNMSNPPSDIGPIYWDNPYFVRYESFESDQRYRSFSNITLNYAPLKWLNITGRVALDSYDELQEERNGFGSINIAGYSRFNQTFREFNYDLFANVDLNISDNLNFKGLVGGNLRQNDIRSIYATTNGGLIVPGIYDLANSLNPITAPVEADQRVEVGGVFAGITLAYKNMLILDATARRDKSSTLPEGNNAYFYPSISGGFVFSKLLPNATWLSLGKLRLNYAQVGNSAPYDYIVDAYDQPTPYGSVPLFSVSGTKKNAALKPEKTKSIEGGVELAFLKNRIGLDVTYFKTNTIDQIIPITISASSGYTTQIINAGNVENRGLEVSLNLNPVKTNNFNWTMSVNWSRLRNKVISLTEGTENVVIGSFQGGVTLNAAIGQPFGTLRGSDFVYDSATGQKVVGSDGYYLVTQSTNNVLGNINPDWTGGVNNTFTYKQLTLSFLIDARHGGSIYSIDQWYGQGTGLYENTAGLNELGNPVRDPIEDGGGVLFPGVSEDGKTNSQRALLTGLRGYGYNNFPNAGYVYDASYIKLREANITYSFSKKLMSRLSPIKGIDVSLYGRNLWIIHKNLPYADPEEGPSSGNIQGFQVGSYPTYRTYGFNLKFTF